MTQIKTKQLLLLKGTTPREIAMQRVFLKIDVLEKTWQMFLDFLDSPLDSQLELRTQ